ncbi:MAG: hypothetical protein GC165_11215 [Armatimonadetes bacterium]|nr:hypothetical protein [Armatimonadota bacterium]
MIAPIFAAFALASLQTGKPSIALSAMPREPLGEETMLDALRDEIRLEVQGAYVSVKWSDLENDQPFNAKAMQDALGMAKFIGGDSIVVCIKAVDTSVKSVPIAYATRKFDDPEVVKHWEDMLQQVIPLLPKQTKAIALGNEVDVYFHNHPDELPSFMELVKTTRAFLKGAGVKAPIGMITSFDGLQRHPDLVKQIQSGFDVTMMTYYPLDQTFQVLPMEDVGRHFDSMLAVAGSKPLFLTEVGCPAGESNKSSEDLQAQFVAKVFDQLKQRGSKISFANYFMQGDYPNQMLDMFEQYYQFKDDNFRSYLGTLGLRKSDGTPRKAYAEFKRQMRAWVGE